MSQKLPLVAIADGMLTVYFSESIATQWFDIACVIDLTDFGDVVGIEVLDWRRQLSGGQVEASPVSGDIRWSYDDEVDAFYIHTMEGRGQRQQSATGTAKLDSNRRVVAFEIPLSSPEAYQPR